MIPVYEYEVSNPGILEVPDGKKVSELPVSHFKDLIDRKGRAKIIRALTNLQNWNKNDNKSLSNWAKSMKNKLGDYGSKKEKYDKSISMTITDGEDQIEELLEYIKEIANYGHSFTVVVDPNNDYEKKFYIDGDGLDHINTINIEEIEDE